MAIERAPSNHSDERYHQAHEVLEVLSRGVSSQEFEIVNEIAFWQSVLPPSEVASYMDHRRHSGDAESDAGQWGKALRNFLSTIKAKEDLDPIERKKINDIFLNFEFPTDVASNSDEFKPDSALGSQSLSTQKFRIDTEVDREMAEKMLGLPVFQHAEQLASGMTNDNRDFKAALKYIEDTTGPTYFAASRSLLDWYVYVAAEQYAAGWDYTPPDPNKAKATALEYASSAGQGRAILEQLGLA